MKINFLTFLLIILPGLTYAQSTLSFTDSNNFCETLEKQEISENGKTVKSKILLKSKNKKNECDGVALLENISVVEAEYVLTKFSNNNLLFENDSKRQEYDNNYKKFPKLKSLTCTQNSNECVVTLIDPHDISCGMYIKFLREISKNIIKEVVSFCAGACG